MRELWIWPELIGAGSALLAIAAAGLFLWWKLRRRRSSVESAPDPLARVRFGVCPDCRRPGLLAGPRGGLSQNLLCAQCGARFNVGPILPVQRLPEAVYVDGQWVAPPSKKATA